MSDHLENILRAVSKFWRIREGEIYALRKTGMTREGHVMCPLTLACALAFGTFVSLSEIGNCSKFIGEHSVLYAVWESGCLGSMPPNFAIECGLSLQRSRPDSTTFFLRTLRFCSLVKTDSQLTTSGCGTVLRDRTKTALEPAQAH